MGYLTTHVLDTAQGLPGSAIKISLFHISDQRRLVKTLVTNSDGRTDRPVLGEDEFEFGDWELVFSVGEYFEKSIVPSHCPPFLNEIALRFNMSVDEHYHVPLLVSPWSYSTYKGS